MRKITKHGKLRIKERINKGKNYRGILTRALRYGYTENKYEGEFYKYLKKRSIRGARIKVYGRYIYVIAKNSKNLITLYPVPQRFLPTEQYEIKMQRNI